MFVGAPPAAPVPATDAGPCVDPILNATTTVTNAPMPDINAPGTNIARLSPPVDVNPMIRSGKPIMNKIIPITNVIFHCVMNLDRAWKLQSDSFATQTNISIRKGCK